METQTLEWCRRLIATPSVTTEGTRQLAQLCAAELLKPAGADARLISSPHEGEEQVNLLATVRGRDSGAAPIVLNTHLDTVPAGDHKLWTECGGDAFAATIHGDRIFGLGAADTKLDFVAKATAVARCGRPRRDVYLLGTFGEEHGLVGAKEVAEAGLLPRGALTFVGEPSNLAVVTAHKGLMVFELLLRAPGLPTDRESQTGGQAARILFTGRSAHSSTPALGRNAIAAALNFVAAQPGIRLLAIEGGDAVNKVAARCEVAIAGEWRELPDDAAQIGSADAADRASVPAVILSAAAKFAEALLNFSDRSGAEPDFAAPAMTSNIGVVRWSHPELRLEFEVRPPPGMPIDSVRQNLQSISSILGRRFRGVQVELRELRANPGFRSVAATETVEIALAALARSGLKAQTAVKAGCTEAGIYAAGGLKPVVFGPGPSTGVIHAPNEYNLLSEVENAIRFYCTLLEL